MSCGAGNTRTSAGVCGWKLEGKGQQKRKVCIDIEQSRKSRAVESPPYTEMRVTDHTGRRTAPRVANEKAGFSRRGSVAGVERSRGLARAHLGIRLCQHWPLQVRARAKQCPRRLLHDGRDASLGERQRHVELRSEEPGARESKHARYFSPAVPRPGLLILTQGAKAPW